MNRKQFDKKSLQSQPKRKEQKIKDSGSKPQFSHPLSPLSTSRYGVSLASTLGCSFSSRRLRSRDDALRAGIRMRARRAYERLQFEERISQLPASPVPPASWMALCFCRRLQTYTTARATCTPKLIRNNRCAPAAPPCAKRRPKETLRGFPIRGLGFGFASGIKRWHRHLRFLILHLPFGVSLPSARAFPAAFFYSGR